MAATIREMFPFGDVGDDTVAAASDQFPGLPAQEIGAGIELAKAVVEVLQFLSDVLDESGLTPARWRLLMALSLQSPRQGATIGELAGHLQVREPTVTATVDRLEREGKVARRRDQADRRLVRVALTPDGDRAVATLIPRLAARFQGFVGAMGGPDETRDLARRIASATQAMAASAAVD